jgi:hypothetical protein
MSYFFRTFGFWFKPANFFNENPAIDVMPIIRDPIGNEDVGEVYY